MFSCFFSLRVSGFPSAGLWIKIFETRPHEAALHYCKITDMDLIICKLEAQMILSSRTDFPVWQSTPQFHIFSGGGEKPVFHLRSSPLITSE